MRKVQSITRSVSFLVILSFLSLVASPGYSQSLKGSSLSGRILSSDQKVPITGAIVKAAEIESKKIYESKPTIENGYYEILGLEKGTYDIAVQIDNGLYIANKLLNIGEGEAHSLSLALNESPAKPEEEEEKGEEGEVKKHEDMDEEKLGFWDNPLTATLALVGIATVVGFGINELTEAEERASPF